MKHALILTAALAAAMSLGTAALAQEASPRGERNLRERVEATAGKERGAASAELAKFLETEARWSEAASEWRQARKLRGDVADFEGEARTVLAFAEDVVASGETGSAVAAAFEDAQIALRHAKDAGSKSIDVPLGLARCAEIANDNVTRVAVLTQAVAASPDDVRPARALVAALAASGKPEDAIELCAKLSDAHPNDATLALGLYESAKAAADEPRARAAALRAVAAAPEDARGWNAIWSLYAPKQRWSELADTILEVAKANPEGAWTAHYAGISCARARRFDEALEWLRKACARKDANAGARCEAARILFNEKNDREGAVKLYAEALALEPSSEQAYAGLFFVAKRFTDEGNPKASVPLFELIAKARPRDVVCQGNLANAYRFAGRYPESEKAYLAAIEAYPSDAQLRNDYALLLDVVGRQDDACKVLAAAHEVDPVNNDSMENLAFLARGRGDRDGALHWFRLAHAALVARGVDDHKHRMNVDDQRWPLLPLR